MTKCELKEHIKKIIKEVLNEDYIPSTDPENILFDFYVLSYISSINLDVTSKGYGGGFIGKDPEELKSLIADAENKLLPYLKNEMLDAVFYSLGCEIRYAAQFDEDFGEYKYEWETKNPFMFKYLTKVIRIFGKNPRLPTRFVSRTSSNSLISVITNNSMENKMVFVTGAQTVFSRFEWPDDYGGNSWANICDGWLRLYKAKTVRDLYVAIDHIYDLQHNTGSVFNKVEKYLKDKVGITWLAKALNLKAEIKNIHVLMPLCSSDMRRIALMVLKRANISPPSRGLRRGLSTSAATSEIEKEKLLEYELFKKTVEGEVKNLDGYEHATVKTMYDTDRIVISIVPNKKSLKVYALEPIDITVNRYNNIRDKYEIDYDDLNDDDDPTVRTYKSLGDLSKDLSWFISVAKAAIVGDYFKKNHSN